MHKILIAEDDTTSAKILKKTIESLGHTVILAGNGKRAFETLVDNPDISLLVTDVMMPELDGTELTRIIRGNQALEKLPVIIISAVASLEEVKDLLLYDASEFMKKPVNLEHLKNSIRRCLNTA